MNLFFHVDFAKVLDWNSISLNGICVFLAVTGGGFLILASLVATATTIIHNTIRIYKELKTLKNEKNTRPDAESERQHP
jgi:hypothetical protein